MRYFVREGVYYQYNVRKKLPWVRISEMVFTIVLIVMFAGFAYQLVAAKVDESRHKIKGKMVDIGGYRLFTNTTGQGNVTVVFESDIGKPVQQWNKVRDSLASGTRIFIYDRAGFGWSDRGQPPTDIEKQVRELRSLLKKSAVKSPFILVGHGYGGMVMTKFAEQYPDEVAGVVLINSWTNQFVNSAEFKKEISRDLTEAQLLKYSSFFGITRLIHNFESLKEESELTKGLSEENIALYKAHQSTSKYNRALVEELKALKNYSGNISLEGILRDKPVYVVSSLENSLSANKASEWQEYQKGLLKLSSKSELINIKDSSTYIHIDKPGEIINLINTIIKKVTK